jgi:hypothetical protein
MRYEQSKAIIFTTLLQDEEDAHRLEKILSGHPYSFDTTCLTYEQATKDNLRNSLASLESLDYHSRIFVYISSDTGIDTEQKSHIKSYPFGESDKIYYSNLLMNFAHLSAKNIGVIVESETMYYDFEPCFKHIAFPPEYGISAERTSRQAILSFNKNQKTYSLPTLLTALDPEKRNDPISFFLLWYEKIIFNHTYLCNLLGDDGGDLLF